jgi:phenylacetate-CoA ligase
MGQLTTRIKRLGLSDAVVRRNPLFYRTAARIVREFDGWTEEERAEWLREKTRALLSSARRTAYGLRVGSPVSLGRWPVLDKQAIRESAEQFFSGSGLITVGASTSGTTGTPLQLRRSLASVAFEQAAVDSVFTLGGVDPTTCRMAVLRGDDIKDPADTEPPFWRTTNGGRRLVFSANHLHAGTLKQFVTALRDYDPQVIFAYPTVLDSLCSLMREQNEQLNVPLTVCSSEVLTRATTELAHQTLNTRVLDYYGQAERVSFAYGSPTEGYRFLPCYSINELEKAESTEDTDIYELICTGLWNDAMPLIRYRTGDRILLDKGSDPAAVAAGRASFREIAGRSDDYLISPDGARLMGIDHIPRNVVGIVRAQFVQESPTEVVLRVIPAPEFDEQSRATLVRQAATKLPPTMNLRIEETSQLMRNKSGKAPLVMRVFEK